MDKYQLSERHICTKFITPAIQQAGWQQHQFREEVNLTDGRVMVRGKLASRIKNPEAKGGPKRADFVLYARPNVPIAVIEAKQARFSLGHGMQQALAYAEMLDASFAISSNGCGFLLHDRTGLTEPIERELALTQFPSLDDLWPLYQQWKGLTEAPAVKLIEQPFYSDGSGKEPRHLRRTDCLGTVETIGSRLLARLLRQKPAPHSALCRSHSPEEIVSAVRRQLSWTRIKPLIYIDDPLKRDFYPEMCQQEGCSPRPMQDRLG